jgi:hypothetical protein
MCERRWQLFLQVNSFSSLELKFVRALLFSYLEEIILGLGQSQSEHSAKEEYETFLAKISNSKQDLILRGYDEFIFECFYDVVFPLQSLIIPPTDFY